MDKYIKIINDDTVIRKIKPFIKNKKVYIVGGYIRDIITGKTSTDRDLIICDEETELFAKDLADKLNAYFIELDYVNNIYRLVLEDKINYIDITCPVEGDLTKDIKRRDLTINAIVYDINKEEFIDLTGGISDIKNEKIKGISEKNFEDDPLRLLRIFRFAAVTGYKIDKSLFEIVRKHFKEINKPAKERITAELLKLFEGKYSHQALLQMDRCNLLEEIFPIYKEIKKIPSNTHHHLDLFHHLVETVNQIQIIYENSNDEIKEYLNSEPKGTIKRLAFLKLAGFLHDIGKPSCWTIDEDTLRHRFIKHDEVGSQLSVPILKELKFSKKQIEYIKNLIKYHIYPSSLICSPDTSEKAIMKFYRKTEDYVIDVIILAMADRLSARGIHVTEEMVKTNINGLTALLNNYLKIRRTITPCEKFLNGCDIMEILGIQSGPILGKIIKALQEAQLSGEISDKQHAADFVKKYYSECIDS